jgi:hypothetical protein
MSHTAYPATDPALTSATARAAARYLATVAAAFDLRRRPCRAIGGVILRRSPRGRSSLIPPIVGQPPLGTP